MRIILQILGRLNYDEVTFDIDGDQIRDRLSSRALARKLGNSEIIFLCPESLVTELTNNENEAGGLLSEKNKLIDKMHKNLATNGYCRILLMQSIGTYGRKDLSISFSNTADNIIVSLILDLLEEVQNCDEVILDVSTGHNVYVASLMDAARALIVYFKLARIISKGEMPTFKVAYFPPVIEPSGGATYPIRFYDFDVKAFFSLPFEDETLKIERLLKNCEDIELRKELNSKFEDLGRSLRDLIVETKIAYNAIKYNAPLAYFDDELVSFDIECEDVLEGMRDVFEYITEVKKMVIRCENELTVKRASVERKSFINLLLTIALHNALKEFKEDLSNKDPIISTIKKDFKNLYSRVGLNLNLRFLERDLEEIKSLLSFLIEGKETSINELNRCRFKEYRKIEVSKHLKRRKGDIKRNFFAHSGFEETVTLVRKIGKNEALIRYKPERKSEIRRWIKNP